MAALATLFWRGFDRMLDALAALAAVLIAGMFVIVVYDVTTRNLGRFTITWGVAMTEYALLYVTALGAPWLLRERGHASMEALRGVLPDGVNRVTEKIVALLCLAACVVAAVAAVPVIQRSIGTFDMRARFVPRWILFVPAQVTFALCAIQFARFLFTSASMFKPAQETQDGI